MTRGERRRGGNNEEGKVKEEGEESESVENELLQGQKDGRMIQYEERVEGRKAGWGSSFGTEWGEFCRLAAGREDGGKDGGMQSFVEYTPSQVDW